MKTQTTAKPCRFSEVKSVSRLNVNGSRYVEIAYDLNGQMSVLMPDTTNEATTALFQRADEMESKANDYTRRAALMRKAAFHLIKERDARKAS